MTNNDDSVLNVDDLDEEEREAHELALYYEAHAGDLSLWKKQPKRIRVRRGGPSHTFSIRFAPEEIDYLQEQADANNVTITEFVRSAALAAARSQGEVVSASEVDDVLTALQTAVADAQQKIGARRRRPVREARAEV
jgi:hypothetical protein